MNEKFNKIKILSPILFYFGRFDNVPVSYFKRPMQEWVDDGQLTSSSKTGWNFSHFFNVNEFTWAEMLLLAVLHTENGCTHSSLFESNNSLGNYSLLLI